MLGIATKIVHFSGYFFFFFAPIATCRSCSVANGFAATEDSFTRAFHSSQTHVEFGNNNNNNSNSKKKNCIRLSAQTNSNSKYLPYTDNSFTRHHRLAFQEFQLPSRTRASANTHTHLLVQTRWYWFDVGSAFFTDKIPTTTTKKALHIRTI